MTIWLAIVSHTEQPSKEYTEYHIRFEGHTTVESATKEVDEIRRRLIIDEKLPLDCYIYEAEEPKYGYQAYNLDDIDFNFYRELTPEEKERKAKIEKEVEDSMHAAAR